MIPRASASGMDVQWVLAASTLACCFLIRQIQTSQLSSQHNRLTPERSTKPEETVATSIVRQEKQSSVQSGYFLDIDEGFGDEVWVELPLHVEKSYVHNFVPFRDWKTTLRTNLELQREQDHPLSSPAV